MNTQPKLTSAPMTADAFVEWAMEQPRGKFALVSGEVIAMAPERAEHADAKGELFVALRDAIRAKNLPCRAYVDSLTVKIDEMTVYEPDVLVNCGERVPPQSVWATNPIIVAEVVSPLSKLKDTSTKLADYFCVPSIQHYLVVDLRNCSLVHHRRGEGESIVTMIVKSGNLRLDPPGIEIDLGKVLPATDELRD